MVAAATTTYGGVDSLVHNAARMAELKSQSAVDAPLADWNRIFDVNLTGALICPQAVVPELRKRGGGKIVNQVSAGAFPAQSIYGISKLALGGLTTTLARQVGREKIHASRLDAGKTPRDAGQHLTPASTPVHPYP